MLVIASALREPPARKIVKASTNQITNKSIAFSTFRE